MQSMTGYGEGHSRGKNFSLGVELQSYNHRFLDVQIKLPPEYIKFEKLIFDAITSRLTRGRVNVFVSLKTGPGSSSVLIDEKLAEKYWRALKRLRKELKLSEELPPASLLELPGVIRIDSGLPSARQFKKCLIEALGTALNNLIVMRGKEGRALKADLKKHFLSLKKCLGKIQKRISARKSPRGKSAVDRGDAEGGTSVREEIDRLESHLAQFEDALEKIRPAGKITEFITREIMRETTTLADKADDSYVSEQAVYMKLELENLREQIRNIE